MNTVKTTSLWTLLIATLSYSCYTLVQAVTEGMDFDCYEDECEETVLSTNMRPAVNIEKTGRCNT